MRTLKLQLHILGTALGLALLPTRGFAQPPSPTPRSSEQEIARADSDMRRVLDKLKALGAKPVEALTPAEARKQPTPTDAVKAVLKDEGQVPPTSTIKKTDMTYATAGGSQPIRLYIPQNRAGNEPLPVITYFHGGGWVIADIDTYEASAMALAELSNAIVASAEYRKGPEHKFPAAHEDAFAAYQWVLANASKFGGDPSRVAVAGESAGGNLAANVAIMARDKGVQAPVHLLLVYPVAGADMMTPSYRENANAVPLDKASMDWFVKNALPSAQTAQDPRINLLAAKLDHLPPSTIITAEIDPLQSEGKALADKLEDAGSKATYENYDGVTHEFFGMAAVVSDAQKAQAFAAKELKAAFASPPKQARD